MALEANPSAHTAQKWVQSELIGEEKLARIDARQLSMLSSLLIGFIIKMYRAMETQQGTISAEIANEGLLKVFEVFQMTKFFEAKAVPV